MWNLSHNPSITGKFVERHPNGIGGQRWRMDNLSLNPMTKILPDLPYTDELLGKPPVGSFPGGIWYQEDLQPLLSETNM